MNQFNALQDFVLGHAKLLVITGAGISAGSGIPTYRNDAGEWQRSQPIQHQQFINDAAMRRRYWARSALGWRYVAKAAPNQAHEALVRLEAAGKLTLLITQNVDRLHQRAGHRHVVDLHGRIDQVVCLSCGAIESRETLQDRLLADNPQLQYVQGVVAPDGDAEFENELAATIDSPHCQLCDGVQMPDVIFYGGSVPKNRVEYALAALQAADAVLAIGSSLMTYSAFQFCKAAGQQGKPIAAINLGKTRADPLISVKLEQDCVEVLSELAFD